MKRTVRHRRAVPPEFLENRSLLTSFTVTSLADNLTPDSETTLREALVLAESDANPEIVFAAGLSGTINLVLGELDLSNHTDLIITGNGRSETIIDAHGNSDLFEGTGGNLTLRSLALQGSSGSGIVFETADTQLTIEDALITGNAGHGLEALGDDQSGSKGKVVVRDSSITSNAGRGIRLFDETTVELLTSDVSGNAGGVVLEGGPGEEPPELIAQGAAIRDNVTSEPGGGIRVMGTLKAELIVRDSAITGNQGLSGGGIAMEDPRWMSLLSTTIANNTAIEDGGGLYLKSDRLLPTMLNLTIAGNTARRGGGIFSNATATSLSNSTVVGNTAIDEGGGYYRTPGQNLSTFFHSNIFVENTVAGAPADLSAAVLQSHNLTHNLIGTNAGTDLITTGLSPDARGNMIGSSVALLDAKLQAPRLVGVHEVYPPQPNSPVVDAGNNVYEWENDQIGITREAHSDADIGAVEFVPAIFVEDRRVNETDSGSGQVTFDLIVTEETDPFTVDVFTADDTATAGVDYEAHSETLSFSGTRLETQQVHITFFGDAKVEIHESFLLRFTNISTGAIDPPPDAVGTLLNDDINHDMQLNSGTLLIRGGPDADVIEVSRPQNSLFVEVKLNEERGSFVEEDINQIRILGNDGDDTINVFDLSQRSSLFGGNGDDTIRSDSGRNWFWGGAGNDELFGGTIRDVMRGEDGHDLIVGGAGNDVLRGGDGDDTLRGDDGNDLIYGENDDDVLEGGSGNDKMRGAGGNDTLRGGAGVDSVAGGGGHDLLNGGNDADIISGNNGTDRMNGGNGNDYMNAGAGQDIVRAGAGDDTLLGREGNDVLFGDEGNDFLNGLTEKDVLYGGEGNDTLQGRASEDILIAGTITPANGSSLHDMLTGSIRDEWLSARTYEQRVANITDGPGKTGNRLNTEFLIGSGRAGQTVFDDGIADELIGGSGFPDLFFARLGSDTIDNANSEFLEEI